MLPSPNYLSNVPHFQLLGFLSALITLHLFLLCSASAVLPWWLCLHKNFNSSHGSQRKIETFSVKGKMEKFFKFVNLKISAITTQFCSQKQHLSNGSRYILITLSKSRHWSQFDQCVVSILS